MDVTLENSHIKDRMKDLRRSYEASVGQLRERQRQLEVAQVENQLLKMKVKCGGADSPRPFSSFPFLLSPPIFSNSSPFLCFPSWRSPHFCGQLCRAWLEGTEGVSVFTAVSPDWGAP